MYMQTANLDRQQSVPQRLAELSEAEIGIVAAKLTHAGIHVSRQDLLEVRDRILVLSYYRLLQIERMLVGMYRRRLTRK